MVSGSRFEGGLSYLCRFGDASVNATYLNDEQLQCESPTNEVGVHALEVSVDAYNFTMDTIAFGYYPVPEVYGLFPTGGPVGRGQTFVVVRGSGVVSGSDYRCKFGQLVVRAMIEQIGTLLALEPDRIADIKQEVAVSKGYQPIEVASGQHDRHVDPLAGQVDVAFDRQPDGEESLG